MRVVYTYTVIGSITHTTTAVYTCALLVSLCTLLCMKILGKIVTRSTREFGEFITNTSCILSIAQVGGMNIIVAIFMVSNTSQ